jgi:2,5-furandicarboxylate decarboxylase 1
MIMSLREYLTRLEDQGGLTRINKSVSKSFQIAGILKQLEPRPVLFEHVKESGFPAMGNLFCGKDPFADYFKTEPAKIIPLLSNAIKHPTPYETVSKAPCQEVVINDPDLEQIPLLMHCKGDGGNYLSSGVFIAAHPKYGQNADFHRGMQISSNQMAIRVVKGRHFDAFLQDLGKLDVAVCVGLPPNILAAAATSVEIGVDELEIANTLEPFQAVKAKTVDLNIPAESEFVLEGTVYLDKRHAEGPFVDLTGTHDIIRQEPVFEIKTISHRRDAIWHALLPGALEHKLLMGMPREPTIFNTVNQVVDCRDVNVNPGGCSWLHAIVQINKQHEGDGKKAIQAAFEGHRSCKHVYVVDTDINIYDPLEVEWAMATRFQGDRDMLVYDKAPGSSLDPSAYPDTKNTTRVGFDLTKPLGADSAGYKKVEFPQINLKDYLEG